MGTEVEFKPHFHEWATVLPGMICLSRKARNATFRNYVAAETATPVIGCCACLTQDDAKNFYFAGVCRSKSVRGIDDGRGPTTDEFFTLAIGGMVTMLNNSKTPVFPGDMLEWCFYNEENKAEGERAAKRTKSNPRRIGIKIASPTSERVIGRCLSFAKPMVRLASEIHPLFFSPTFRSSPPRHTHAVHRTPSTCFSSRARAAPSRDVERGRAVCGRDRSRRRAEGGRSVCVTATRSRGMCGCLARCVSKRGPKRVSENTHARLLSATRTHTHTHTHARAHTRARVTFWRSRRPRHPPWSRGGAKSPCSGAR